MSYMLPDFFILLAHLTSKGVNIVNEIKQSSKDRMIPRNIPFSTYFCFRRHNVCCNIF